MTAATTWIEARVEADMYSIGDYVIYRCRDVCKVMDVAQLRAATAERDCVYYYLRPLDCEGMIYVPVADEAGLRPPISRAQARDLLSALGDMPVPVSNARDKRALEAHYRELLRSNDCAALARTVKSIYSKNHGGERHRLSTLEEQILRRTELTLCEELAIALGASEDDVRAQLRHALQADASA